MAKIVVKNASLLIHSKQLASLASAIVFEAEAEKKVCTNFASAGWEESLQGIRAHNLSAEIYLENAAEPEKTLHDAQNDATSVAFSAIMNYPPVAGDVALFAQVVPLNLLRRLQVGEPFGATLTLGPQTPAVRGVVLEYNTGRTATGDSAELELAAVAATERLYAAVHVLSVSGTSPTLDIEIESDATGFASPTTRITIPQFTAVGSYVTFVDGAITDDFFRVAATIGGSDTPTFAYVVEIGIVPKA